MAELLARVGWGLAFFFAIGIVLLVILYTIERSERRQVEDERDQARAEVRRHRRAHKKIADYWAKNPALPTLNDIAR